MEHFKDILKTATNGGNGEVKMWQSIAIVDELLEDLKTHHHEKYEEFMHKQHKVLFGNHYNEELAKADVAKMHHTNKGNGAKIEGEHFAMEKAKSVYLTNKNKLSAMDNVYDVYVAINANYHDKANLFNSWFDSAEAENSIIEDAIAFYFADEDATEGKVYIYMEAIAD